MFIQKAPFPFSFIHTRCLPQNSGGKGFERNGKDPKKTGTDVADPVDPVQIDGSVSICHLWLWWGLFQG